jgi:hypothetical protein
MLLSPHHLSGPCQRSKWLGSIGGGISLYSKLRLACLRRNQQINLRIMQSSRTSPALKQKRMIKSAVFGEPWRNFLWLPIPLKKRYSLFYTWCLTIQECVVCFERHNWSRLPPATHLRYHDVCERCIERHVKVRINEGNTNIGCPAEGCPIPLEYEVIKQYSSKQAFNKFFVVVV